MSELVTDYLEGELPLRGRIAVRWHLVMCDACSAYYDQMRRTAALLGDATVRPPEPAVEAAVMQRVRNDPAAD